MAGIENDWKEVLQGEFKKDYYRELYSKVVDAYSKYKVFPKKEDLFNAFAYTPFEKVKVVILGQDPYHNDGQAHGLCFSVQKGVAVPPSLVNIYKELEDDLGCPIPNHGNLTKWTNQGVLLLNTVLTVKAHMANSHRGIGWEQFTDAAIQALNEVNRPIVFILWGGPAGKKASMLTNPNHLVLKAPHPSPLSSYRGFFGSKPFSKTNEFLHSRGEEPIDWQID
ncbi:uracil-DNA glycosylase [Aequitasia blattaphilus]|uniref:Uracil-DNA glycosylase n=1 Tax=Aequitasia blattaphilus TaxID=2949332 RepID=A0ABT1E9W4_9FIRM|nr:uracil-DNA glycosylase [Aequitasia blattaphilus]MCP1102615.1 uracil-DNA glycosylase [Aequitasia blattaphilus]MCR8615255.1 uracil-DNA glycosylase [Aequitasia blattaphilus]